MKNIINLVESIVDDLEFSTENETVEKPEFIYKKMTHIIYDIGEIKIVKLSNPLNNTFIEIPVQVESIIQDGSGSPPLYNVLFCTRWLGNNDKPEDVSGTIQITNFALWRYVIDREPTEEEIKLFDVEEELSENFIKTLNEKAMVLLIHS